MALMVCRETSIADASSACESPRSARSALTSFFICVKLALHMVDVKHALHHESRLPFCRRAAPGAHGRVSPVRHAPAEQRLLWLACARRLDARRLARHLREVRRIGRLAEPLLLLPLHP